MVKESFPNLTGRTEDVTDVETVIVGAGPAGLAVAACLRRAGMPLVILEREDRVGASWHRHYARLHLHTDKAHSALPYLPLPKDYPKYPSRGQLIAYLESYARHFGLEPRASVKRSKPHISGTDGGKPGLRTPSTYRVT